MNSFLVLFEFIFTRPLGRSPLRVSSPPSFFSPSWLFKNPASRLLARLALPIPSFCLHRNFDLFFLAAFIFPRGEKVQFYVDIKCTNHESRLIYFPGRRDGGGWPAPAGAAPAEKSVHHPFCLVRKDGAMWWGAVMGRGGRRHPGIPSLPLVVLIILVVRVVLGEGGYVTVLRQIEWWWIDLSVHVWFCWLHRRARKILVQNLAHTLEGIFLEFALWQFSQVGRILISCRFFVSLKKASIRDRICCICMVW